MENSGAETLQSSKTPAQKTTATPKDIVAGTPGVVTQVLVKAGDKVSVGQTLCVLEVMKMENEIKTSSDGVVSKVLVNKGEQVVAGQKLFEMQ